MLLFDIEVMFEHDRNMGILEKFMHQLGYSTALYRLRRIVRVHTRVEDGSAWIVEYLTIDMCKLHSIFCLQPEGGSSSNWVIQSALTYVSAF